MKVIGFDLGASSGKVQVGDFNGEILSTETVHRFQNRQLNIGGNLYWNLQGIYLNLIEGIRKALVAAPDAGSIGIDTYCNDFGILGPMGDLISQIRCYRDPRGTRCADTTYGKISQEELYQMTGNQNADFNTIMQLSAMMEEGEGELLSPKNTLVLLPDLLGYFLTDMKVAEFTVSSVTQLFSYQTQDWHDEILKRMGIPRALFPKIVSSGTRLGRISSNAADQIGVDFLEVVSVCSHDTASAVAALPSNQRDVAYISSGTWSLVGAELDHPIISQEAFELNFAMEGCAEGRWRINRNVMGLWIIQECRMDWIRQGMEYSFEELVALAEVEQTFRSLIDPDDRMFYSSGNMVFKVRSYCEKTRQKVPETPGQVIRCVEESLAMRYRWALEHLERITEHHYSNIYILGGGGNDRLLNQLTASACNRLVYVGPKEAALVGNMLMQLTCYGETSNLREGRELVLRSAEISTYEPRDVSIWDEVYGYWCDLVHIEGSAKHSVK